MYVCMYVCMYTNTHIKRQTHTWKVPTQRSIVAGVPSLSQTIASVQRLADYLTWWCVCVCVCVYVLCKTGRLRLTCVCLTHAYMHACMCEYRVRVCRTHNQGVRACDTYIHISLPDLVTALSERVMSSAESCTFARYGFRIWQNSTKVRVRSPCATAPSTSPMLTKALLTTGGSITPV